MAGARGCFFDFGGRFMDKTVRSSPWGDGSQWAGPNTAIESFWRCILVEMWLFLWSIKCPGLRRVSGTSPGGPRRVPGGPRGVPGKPQGPGEDLFGHWGPFRGPVAIFFPASKCPKTSKIVKNHKKAVKTGSKPVFGGPKP